MADDECFIVSTSEAEAVSYVWAASTRVLHHTLKHNAGVANGTVVLGDCTVASAQGARAAIHTWTLPGETPVQKSPVPEKLGPLAASQDFLFGGGRSGRLYVWARGSGALVASVEAHYREVSALAVTGDGACVVSGGDDGIIHVWLVSSLVDVKSRGTPTAQHTFSSHGLRITQLLCGVGPYGEGLVVSSSLDSTVKLWRLPTGMLVADIVYASNITCVALDALEQTLFAGAADGSIFCSRFGEEPLRAHMSVDNGEDAIDRTVFRGHTGAIAALKVVAFGLRPVLVSAAADTQVHMWDVASGQLMASFRKHTAAVTSLEVITRLPQQSSDKRSAVVDVGKLQKYPRSVGPDGVVPPESALHWCTMLAADLPDAGPPPFPAIVLDPTTVGMAGGSEGASELRAQELAAEVARLQEENRKLFEMDVDRVLAAAAKKKKKLKVDGK